MKAKGSIVALNDEEVTLNVIAEDGLYTDTVTVRALDDYLLFSSIASGRRLHDVIDLEVETVERVEVGLKIKACLT